MLNAAGQSLMVGRYRLDPIAEFEGPRMPPAAMFPAVDPQHLTRLLERAPSGSYDKAANQLFTSVHSWLVRDDSGMIMLIDTCFGNNKDRLPTHPFFHMQKNDWLEKLAALGVKPRDVKLVINTHLHLDHVGWNTYLQNGAWKPTFARARHVMPRLEVDLVKSGKFLPLRANDLAIEDSVMPVIEAGLADFVDPGFEVAPDIRLVPCYGHSPGMLLVEISGGSRGVVAGGDPLHHAVQVLDPGMNTRFCEKPAEAATSRHAFVARCADEGWAIAPTHFFVPRVTRLRRTETGFELMQ